MHQGLILTSLMGSLWGKPSWDMNSWLQALQNVHGVHVTSDKALRQRREMHAGSMEGRIESNSWTNCRYSCSRGWGLGKKKKNVTSHWRRLMNFWVRNLTLKLISRFSGDRNQPWAADRGMERALRQCPQQGGLPRAAVFSGISPPASTPGWPELVWALESPITPFAISLPIASPLFWSCPLSHIIARSLLPSLSFAALSPSPY